MYNKYAKLLTQYCLEVQKGDKVMIKSTYLAEKLLVELAKEISIAGGTPVLDIEIQDFNNAMIANSDIELLQWVNPMNKLWNETFDGFYPPNVSFRVLTWSRDCSTLLLSMQQPTILDIANQHRRRITKNPYHQAIPLPTTTFTNSATTYL